MMICGHVTIGGHEENWMFTLAEGKLSVETNHEAGSQAQRNEFFV
jgi:hypothetical protein